ncbi:MAG: ABC transporter permease, partial [Spongiibacteraceae bacterium]
MFMQHTLRYLNLAGFSWLIPVIKLLTLDNPRKQGQEIIRQIGLPLVAILIFLAMWSTAASRIDTSLGSLPGPTAVATAAKGLYQEHVEEREKADAFYQRQAKRNAAKLEKNPDATIKVRNYTGKPTYLDQIITSLITVFTGFLAASIIAIPVGVACRLSPLLNTAILPIIQILKPVSPLAWL